MTATGRSVTREVDAAPEIVWDLISDVTRMGEWSPENVGSRFRGRNRRGRATWSTTCEVLASERGRVFAFGVGKPGRHDTTWRYELTALSGDRTVVRESFTLRKPIGGFSRLVTRITMGVTDRLDDLEDGMRRTLDALAAAAESAARRAP